ncbi:MAG: SusC/RagA family TonB-linked outer membrane protein, partial [Bacteroidetes bacterium]|nr:SusC/RagA family TonB-linked outer membrane protein [Bacteroidota bacterium]
VTAMGIKKERKALGYAVQDLKADELMKNKNVNVINSLAGKIPGVSVVQSGGSAGSGATITIRGGNSASESRDNQPLFVVDGMIYDNSTINGGDSGTDGVTKTATTFSNRVMDINPEDIENMSVLKGAAASALYGSRAADGVIIITTKKGSEGAIKVNFNTKYAYSYVNKLPELQSIYGRGTYNTAGTLNDLTMDSWGDPITGKVYDNIGSFFQGSNVFDNSISVTGGSKTGSFYLSVSNFDQTGIIPNTNYDKTTFRFNGEQKYGILTVGANAAYSQANTLKTLTSAGLWDHGGNGAMYSVYGWPRSDDMSRYLNDDGTKYRMFEGRQEMVNDLESPYWLINKNKITDKTARFTGAVNASLKLADWWDISGRVGVDEYTTDAYTYVAPQAAVKEMYQKGSLSKSISRFEYITTNFMSNFQQKIGDFDLGLLLGMTTEQTLRRNNAMWGYEFVQEGLVSFNNMANNKKFFSDRTVNKRMMGVYGEFHASYKSLAYLTVTGRNDWSSTLPKENRSYFYPSVSGSLVFTELLPKNGILSFGKLRASWAQVGKDANPYSLTTYGRSIATLNGGILGTGDDWTSGSPNLKPEIFTSYELGAELRFFNGRLGIDYTYYDGKTTNQICAPRLAQSTGYIFITLNGGTVTKKGMELAITGRPVVTKDFEWETTLNLSGNRNRLGDFVRGAEILYVTDVQLGGARTGSIPNGGYFYGIIGNKYLREATDATDEPSILATEIPNSRPIIDPATGLYRRTTTTSAVAGNREPKMIGGFNNSLTYKNWNLSFLLDLRLGGDIYNGTEYYLVSRGLSPQTTVDRNSVTFSGVVNKGTSKAPVWEEQTITYQADQTYTIGGTARSGKYMIQQYWTTYLNNSRNFITETNWMRLRSISLSYNFKDILKKQNFVKGLSATVTGTNLWIWTNYKGMDPEVAVSGSGTGGSGSDGFDYCGVPATAGFSFGLNITF